MDMITHYHSYNWRLQDCQTVHSLTHVQITENIHFNKNKLFFTKNIQVESVPRLIITNYYVEVQYTCAYCNKTNLILEFNLLSEVVQYMLSVLLAISNRSSPRLILSPCSLIKGQCISQSP